MNPKGENPSFVPYVGPLEKLTKIKDTGKAGNAHSGVALRPLWVKSGH